MRQFGFNTGVATRRKVDQSTPLRARNVGRLEQQKLELKVAALQRDYAELHAAVFEAAQVHRRLCAPRFVRYGDYEIASEIFAVRHLAGDFFTIENTNSGVVLALGDICGKGLAAGMWTTHLVSRVSARTAVHSEPEWVVSGVNRDVCSIAPAPLASMFVARFDPASSKLEYCSAGHPPAMLLRSSGELELLSDGGLLLGVSATALYVRGTVELGPGDLLLVYSDGVIESLNNSEEEFGISRLETELRRSQDAATEAVLFSVLAAVQDFAAPHPLIDDMSLVTIRRRV